MKPLPIITALLIANNFYLSCLANSLAGWHGGLFRIDGINREYISAHTSILSQLKLDTLGMSALTLILLIVVWRKRLCARWLAGIMMFLWLLVLGWPIAHLP
jgi:hypothetical protein